MGQFKSKVCKGVGGERRKNGFLPPTITIWDSSLLEILHNKEICHIQPKKSKFIHLSSKYYYKSGL